MARTGGSFFPSSSIIAPAKDEAVTSSAEGSAASEWSVRASPVKARAVVSSTNGYRGEMAALQWRHRPLRKSQDRTGTLSRAVRGVWHFGQCDAGIETDIPRGKR